MSRIKILMIVGSLCNGGIEKVVYNIATCLDSSRFEIIVYTLSNQNDYYGEKLINKQIKVIREFDELLKKTAKNKYILLFERINRLLKEEKDIQVVHVHETNLAPVVLMAAYVNSIPVICMHSHNAYSKEWNPSTFSLKSKIAIYVDHLFYYNIPNYKIGCSVNACRRLYGKTKNQVFIPNGIDFSKFNSEAYPSKISLQKYYGLLKDNINLVFVGRFAEQKNVLFLLDSFKIITSQLCTHLSIVGYGELENAIHDKVKELELEEHVSFFPPDSNIPELLKASDYFIGPSLYEGLGIVFVEAQLMGLPAFASDQVPREADLGLCEFIPIDQGPEVYAKYIIDYIRNQTHKDIDPIKKAKYDMREVIRIYESIYEGNNHE